MACVLVIITILHFDKDKKMENVMTSSESFMHPLPVLKERGPLPVRIHHASRRPGQHLDNYGRAEAAQPKHGLFDLTQAERQISRSSHDKCYKGTRIVTAVF